MTPPRHPLLLKVLLIAGMAWWLAMIAMALLTANPAVVSVPQIQQADAVVTGTVPDPQGEKFVVERTWKGDLKPGTITVLNLHEAPALERGKKYVFPVSRFGRSYRITRTEEQNLNTPPIVYPATYEVTDRLQQVLKQ